MKNLIKLSWVIGIVLLIIPHAVIGSDQLNQFPDVQGRYENSYSVSYALEHFSSPTLSSRNLVQQNWNSTYFQALYDEFISPNLLFPPRIYLPHSGVALEPDWKMRFDVDRAAKVQFFHELLMRPI